MHSAPVYHLSGRVWGRGGIGEFNSTVAHKDLTVPLGRQISGRHLQVLWGLSGAVETPGDVSGAHQDFSDEAISELEMSRGRHKGAVFRDREHYEVG